jgi:hypothetical protein
VELSRMPLPTPTPSHELQPVIPEQIVLPLSISFEIVLQGLRIRLGRSLVTLVGVTLGIAFLMSTLAIYFYRQSVATEVMQRAEQSRMLNLLSAEIGSPREQSLGMLVAGQLNATELRFIQTLLTAGAAHLEVHAALPQDIPIKDARLTFRQTSEPPVNTRAIIVAGDPTLNGDVLKSIARVPLLMTRGLGIRNVPPAWHGVQLSPAPQLDELARKATEERRARFRMVWILVISLLVTIMGIANAMLMSVTERFREIGTMKCLGARSQFIRRIFMIESAIMGLTGSLLGVLLGVLLPFIVFGFIYGFALVVGSLNYFGLCCGAVGGVAAGVLLAMLAAIYPAFVASRMVPANALRSSV